MQYTSISRMIITPVMLTVVILVGLNAASIYKTFFVINSFSALESRSIQAERDINIVLSDFKTQVQEWKNVLLRGADNEDRVKYWQRFQSKEKAIQTALIALKENDALSADANATIDAFMKAHDYMAIKYREGYDAFVSANYDSKVGDSYVRGIDREPAKLLSELAQNIAQVAKNQVNDLSSNTRGTIGAIIVLTVLLSVASVFYVVTRLRKQVINPIKEIAKCLVALEKSDYNYTLTYTSKHELGALADAARSLQLKLRNAVAELLDSEEKVIYASEKLAQTSLLIKSGSQKQSVVSESLQENTEKLHGIGQTLSVVATQVSVASQQSESKVSDCNHIFTDANDCFQVLAESVLEASKIVDVLQTRSNTIHNVVNVINEIADQTNLLALNAAIEAARAGEHGRGFAVVADEVRALAAKTQQSTQEINQILSAFENEANSAVGAMTKGRELSDSNAAQSELALQTLQSLVKDVNETAEIVLSLTQATEQQNAVLYDVERATKDVVVLAKDYDDLANNTDISSSIKQVTKQVDKVVVALSQ